jgi:hypothetical protein
MGIRLSGSTSGYTELDAPANAGNNVIQMPANNGSAFQAVRNGATPGQLEFYTPSTGVTMTRATAVATTSGTSIDFTGIPSWVRRITIMFDAVSTNGTSNKQVQIGDSGGIETTGYSAGAVDLQFYYPLTSGFPAAINYNPSSTDAIHGLIVLANLTGNTWTASGGLYQSGYNVNYSIAGAKTLSDTLDRVRLTTINGTDVFAAGTVNIIYEG